MHEVIMPKLGLTMETGVIEKWHKKEGDMVNTGDVLFEVMTDKVSLGVEAYNSGILKKILKKEGDEVPVTEVIAYIGQADEEVPQGQASEFALKQERVEKISEDIEVKTIKPSKSEPENKAIKDVSEEKTVKISPLARNIADELGVDYRSAKIKGSGPGGRIVKEDIIAFAEGLKREPLQAAQVARVSLTEVPTAAAVPPKVRSTEPIKGMRKMIAERLTYSKQNIPHIIQTVVMDVTLLIALREKIKDEVLSRYGVKLTYTDFIIKAAAIVLAEKPVINASLQDGNHIIYEDINIGLAVSVEEGLIVPTLYFADRMNLFDIAAKRVELIEKAKASKLNLDEISNGTFTISNLGMYGVRNFTAIINPPQGAILMVNEIYKAPVVIDDKIQIRSQMEISIAVDHRIIDGADGAKYLARLKEIIENPELLLI